MPLTDIEIDAAVPVNGTPSRALTNAALKEAVVDIAAVQTAVNGKANTVHTHTLANITDAGTAAAANTGTSSGEVPLLDVDGEIPLSMLGKAPAGIDLAAGQDGSLIVQVLGADTRVQQLDALSQNLTVGVDTTIIEWIATYAGELYQYIGRCGTGSYNAIVEVNGSAVTPTSISVTTSSNVTTAITANNGFAVGDSVKLRLTSSTAATDLFCHVGVRRTGA